MTDISSENLTLKAWARSVTMGSDPRLHGSGRFERMREVLSRWSGALTVSRDFRFSAPR